MKVYFDIITNHTADVIGYAEGARRAYVSKDVEPYSDGRRHAVRRPRLRRHEHVPAARRGDVVPVHARSSTRASRTSRFRPG